MNPPIHFAFVSSLPGTLVPNTQYFIPLGGGLYTVVLADSMGNPDYLSATSLSPIPYQDFIPQGVAPSPPISPNLRLFIEAGNLYYEDSTGAVTELGGAGVWAQDTFNPTLGQTSFSLSATPIALAVQAIVNGEGLTNGVDFTVSGTTVSILGGLGFTLEPSDTLQFRYPEA